MAEPHVSTAGITLGASLGITGTVIGAQADALVIGLASAAFVSIWLRHVDTWIKSAAAIFFSAMLASYLSPFAAEKVAEQFHVTGGDPLRLLMALLIGSGAPAIFPKLLSRAGRRASGNDSQEG